MGTDRPEYTKTFDYDGFGRVSREMMDNRVWESAGYEYDRQGRRISIHAHGALGPKVRYEYAGAFLQRVCAVFRPPSSFTCTDASGVTPIITSVTYDALGRRSAMGLPGGQRSYAYEADPNRDLVRDQFVGLAPGSTLTYAYPTHDPLGNVATWSITSPRSEHAVPDGRYAYDARNRLSSWTRNGVTEAFGYDALGNLTTHGGVEQTFDDVNPHALASRGTGSGSKTYDYEGGNLKRAGSRYFTYDSADRLVRAGTSAGASNLLRAVYDAAGERIYEWNGGGGRRGFVGRDLVHAWNSSVHEYRLDVRAFGERVAYVLWSEEMKPVGPPTTSLWGSPFEVPSWLVGLVPVAALGWGLGLALRGGLLVGVARRPGSATVCGVLIVSLAIPSPAFAGGNASWTYGAHAFRWVLSDRLGSAVAVVDEQGLLIHQTRFKPFGGLDGTPYDAPGTASESQHRQVFAGHVQDGASGLTYMNARWQDPETGTFLSVDPVVANIADPQQHNAYSYARNNPVNATDPTGMNCVSIFMCGMVDHMIPSRGSPGALQPNPAHIQQATASIDPFGVVSGNSGGSSGGGSSVDSSGVETLHVIGSGGSSMQLGSDMGGFGLLSVSWINVGGMGVGTGRYGYRSQSASADVAAANWSEQGTGEGTIDGSVRMGESRFPYEQRVRFDKNTVQGGIDAGKVNVGDSVRVEMKTRVGGYSVESTLRGSVISEGRFNALTDRKISGMAVRIHGIDVNPAGSQIGIPSRGLPFSYHWQVNVGAQGFDYRSSGTMYPVSFR